MPTQIHSAEPQPTSELDRRCVARCPIALGTLLLLQARWTGTWFPFHTLVYVFQMLCEPRIGVID